MKYLRKPLSAALLTVLFSASAGTSLAAPPDGVEKGNGTLPTRMEGTMKLSCSSDVIPVELFIRDMIDASQDMFRYSTCNLHGSDVRKFNVDGSFTQWTMVQPTALKVLEICFDDEGQRAEIVVNGTNGKAQHFIGKMVLDENDLVVELNGSVSSGGVFSLHATDDSKPGYP